MAERSVFLGFDIDKNLAESSGASLDIGSINNLAGAGVSDDFIRFYNNLRNTSKITVQLSDISGTYINLANTEFVYTNGTEIEINGSKYYVKDSDNFRSFRLSTDENLTNTVTPPVGDYLRSDAVYFENISALAKNRIRTVDDLYASKILNNITDSALSEKEKELIYSSIIAMLNRTSGFFPSNLNGYFRSINEYVDFYNLKKNKSVFANKNFYTSNSPNLGGSVVIVDNGGLNNTNLSANTNPGIFIVNPKSGIYSRAFSSNENVWNELGANLVVSSNGITVGTLEFSGPNGIDISTKAGANLVQFVAESSNINFTHYVEIFIDGESYSLCLTYEP
jgi:hypothetical protein